MKRLLVVSLALALAPRAHAGPGAAHPGVQATPPIAAPARAPLHQDADERRAIRGCDVSVDCRHPSEAWREIDVELFGRPGDDPWLDGDTGPRATAPTPPPGTSPAALHPELPWLARLTLPDLPVRWDERLIKYLVFYKDDPRGHAIMKGWLEAQGRYHDMIVAELRRAHLPEDLLYVSMIESGYAPANRSRAGASGLWQFMPAAGRIYGLTESHWVDERNDPVRATRAQMDYFADLYQRFGDWDLALAAFNGGWAGVLRSVARYNTNDFWQLAGYEDALPWGTTLYVPKALAAAIIGHNRKLFGFDDVKVDAPERWDDVRVPRSISLAVIARAAGARLDDVKRLNPQLVRGRTPPGRAYVVRVPAGGSARFEARLGALKKDWTGYDAYVLSHGERIEDVALEFGMSARRLRALNGLDRDAEAEGGMTLVVPSTSAADRRRNLDRALDRLYGSGVDSKRGEALIVPVPDKDADVPGRRRVFYRVVSGDSVRGVAKVLGVAKADSIGWNGLEPGARLHARMVLQAWVDPHWNAKKARVRLLDETRIVVVTRGSREHLDLAEARTGRVRLVYKAKREESFAQIGKKFGLGKRDLARINRRSASTVLAPGDKIIVYQVVDRTRSKRAAHQWRKAPKRGRGQDVKVAEAAPATGTASKGDDVSADAGDEADADDGGKADADDADAGDDASDDGDAKPAAAKHDAPKPAAKHDAPKPAAKHDAPKPAARRATPPERHGRTSARDDGPVASPADLDR